MENSNNNVSPKSKSLKVKWVRFLAGAIIGIIMGVLFAPYIDKLFEKTGDEIVVEPIPEKKMYLNICIDSLNIEHYKVKQDETLADILIPHNISYKQIYELSILDEKQLNVRGIKSGNNYALLKTPDSLNNLKYFIYQRDLSEYVVCCLGDTLSISTFKKDIITERKELTGVISSSLYMTIKEAGAPDELSVLLSDIYQWSIDFYGIQKNDSFSIIYDEQFVDSISLGIKDIIAAKFTHVNTPYFAIAYTDGKDDGYWDNQGESLRKSFLKAPLKFSRISSGFSYNRRHPVYKVVRPHLGVDYAAPSGTPVWAVADGVVTSRVYTKGGGNTLKIKHNLHNGRYVTGYLHLRSFAKGIKVGSRVKQSDIIGYVGSTGVSTGPHLDYRIWRNGKAINPLKMSQEKGTPISKKVREEYTIYKDSITNVLNSII